MLWTSRLSLANKCLVLFGGAVVVIILAAMVMPWLRMNRLVEDGQREISRQMVSAWERADTRARARGEPPGEGVQELAGVSARRLTAAQAASLYGDDPFVKDAVDRLLSHPEEMDYSDSMFRGQTFEYRYARSVWKREEGRPPTFDGIILLERRSVEAIRLIALNVMFLAVAGVVVLAVAMVMFYVLTHKLILEPVRQLRATAERVRGGDLSIRSEITTGDEFQELSETFNSMLADLKTSQDQMRSVNAALDVKLSELAASNDALAEASKLKGEFLANVSHELRTPLNSIIGFADLLHEFAKTDADAAIEAKSDVPTTVMKRLRYVENIQSAGRRLLELINSLLEMAKLEAGKVEAHVSKVSVVDACQGLIGLMSPIAEKKGVELKLEIGEDLPVITTDPQKFTQVIFNFLSNAVKFVEPTEKTGRAPAVTLRAERLIGGAPGDDAERVRVSVIDNGPGIPKEVQGKIFEKFYQVDRGYGREHTGTGLGLAISKELAAVLGGEIQMVSDTGRGSMFSLIVPVEFKSAWAPAAEVIRA